MRWTKHALEEKEQQPEENKLCHTSLIIYLIISEYTLYTYTLTLHSTLVLLYFLPIVLTESGIS